MRVLVAGGTGVIGRRLVPLLNAKRKIGWVLGHLSWRQGFEEEVR